MLELDQKTGQMFVAIVISPSRVIRLTREGDSVRIDGETLIPRWAIGELASGIVELMLAEEEGA